MRSVGHIIDYIGRHTEYFGFPPTVVGLPHTDYCAVIHEMGGDGRCTNLKARINDVLLVNSSL